MTCCITPITTPINRHCICRSNTHGTCTYRTTSFMRDCERSNDSEPRERPINTPAIAHKIDGNFQCIGIDDRGGCEELSCTKSCTQDGCKSSILSSILKAGKHHPADLGEQPSYDNNLFLITEKCASSDSVISIDSKDLL